MGACDGNALVSTCTARLALTYAALGLISLVAMGCSEDAPPAPPSIGDKLLVSPFQRNKQEVPMNKARADELGWTEIGSGCDSEFGIRYRKGDTLAPTLIFDKSGHIAGMQMALRRDYPKPPASNVMNNFTMYFMDPAKLCSDDVAHAAGSIGDRVWLRQGTDDYIDVPLIEDKNRLAVWYKGGCLKGMGQHYWQNASKSIEMQDMGNAFLLYSEMKLIGVGFAAFSRKQLPSTPEVSSGKLVSPASEWWEYPVQPLSPSFFTKDMEPSIMQNLNTFKVVDGNLEFDAEKPQGENVAATIHTYFSDNWATASCPTSVTSFV